MGIQAKQKNFHWGTEMNVIADKVANKWLRVYFGPALLHNDLNGRAFQSLFCINTIIVA